MTPASAITRAISSAQSHDPCVALCARSVTHLPVRSLTCSAAPSAPVSGPRSGAGDTEAGV